MAIPPPVGPPGPPPAGPTPPAGPVILPPGTITGDTIVDGSGQEQLLLSLSELIEVPDISILEWFQAVSEQLQNLNESYLDTSFRDPALNYKFYQGALGFFGLNFTDTFVKIAEAHTLKRELYEDLEVLKVELGTLEQTALTKINAAAAAINSLNASNPWASLNALRADILNDPMTGLNQGQVNALVAKLQNYNALAGSTNSTINSANALIADAQNAYNDYKAKLDEINGRIDEYNDLVGQIPGGENLNIATIDNVSVPNPEPTFALYPPINGTFTWTATATSVTLTGIPPLQANPGVTPPTTFPPTNYPGIEEPNFETDLFVPLFSALLFLISGFLDSIESFQENFAEFRLAKDIIRIQRGDLNADEFMPQVAEKVGGDNTASPIAGLALGVEQISLEVITGSNLLVQIATATILKEAGVQIPPGGLEGFLQKDIVGALINAAISAARPTPDILNLADLAPNDEKVQALIALNVSTNILQMISSGVILDGIHTELAGKNAFALLSPLHRENLAFSLNAVTGFNLLGVGASLVGRVFGGPGLMLGPLNFGLNFGLPASALTDGLLSSRIRQLNDAELAAFQKDLTDLTSEEIALAIIQEDFSVINEQARQAAADALALTAVSDSIKTRDIIFGLLNTGEIAQIAEQRLLGLGILDKQAQILAAEFRNAVQAEIRKGGSTATAIAAGLEGLILGGLPNDVARDLISGTITEFGISQALIQKLVIIFKDIRYGVIQKIVRARMDLIDEIQREVRNTIRRLDDDKITDLLLDSIKNSLGESVDNVEHLLSLMKPSELLLGPFFEGIQGVKDNTGAIMPSGTERGTIDIQV